MYRRAVLRSYGQYSPFLPSPLVLLLVGLLTPLVPAVGDRVKEDVPLASSLLGPPSGYAKHMRHHQTARTQLGFQLGPQILHDGLQAVHGHHVDLVQRDRPQIAHRKRRRVPVHRCLDQPPAGREGMEDGVDLVPDAGGEQILPCRLEDQPPVAAAQIAKGQWGGRGLCGGGLSSLSSGALPLQQPGAEGRARSDPLPHGVGRTGKGGEVRRPPA
mmetsp:Transcript_10560/g.29689  ORF Transcript_10560/g.29689 Transcript_10560/m.29689 type:complete len:215 (+) Transcript_10560:42-686(+)